MAIRSGRSSGMSLSRTGRLTGSRESTPAIASSPARTSAT
jgi:hypothetical protein